MRVCMMIVGTLFFFWGHALLAEEVSVSHGGLTLNANLAATGDDWSKGPVVLMTHGTLAHNRMEIMQGLQTMLADRGVSSL